MVSDRFGAYYDRVHTHLHGSGVVGRNRGDNSNSSGALSAEYQDARVSLLIYLVHLTVGQSMLFPITIKLVSGSVLLIALWSGFR